MEVCNFMKKLRERLNNKKGFTLVELIVVIVIILILAAVLIPNVMRYIDSARKSAFQSEASSYLTELQGYEAEYYATQKADLPSTSATRTLPDGITTLTAWDDTKDNIAINHSSNDTTIGLSSITKPNESEGKMIQVEVYHGAVKAFTYANSEHYVSWQQNTGWTNVDEPKAGA